MKLGAVGAGPEPATVLPAVDAFLVTVVPLLMDLSFLLMMWCPILRVFLPSG